MDSGFKFPTAFHTNSLKIREEVQPWLQIYKTGEGFLSKHRFACGASFLQHIHQSSCVFASLAQWHKGKQHRRGIQNRHQTMLQRDTKDTNRRNRAEATNAGTELRTRLETTCKRERRHGHEKPTKSSCRLS